MVLLISSVCFLLLFGTRAAADCQSWGFDFVHEGGPYCINTTDTDYFSFGTIFEGCEPTDIQDSVTPILIAPNSDEYFCSDIATDPDGINMVSTCNVPGEELTKSSLWSGNWIVIIEGLTFAWMRSFDIIAGPPVTITNTPTVTFSVTQTPSTTVTTTITSGFTTTLAPATITVPSTTITRTITIRPPQVTVTSTTTSTRTRTDKVYSKTVKTTTVTTSCKTQPPKRDPPCTIRPTRASLAATEVSATPIPRIRRIEKSVLETFRRNGMSPRHLDGGLIKRAQGPDQCTTTVLDTKTVVTSMITYTASTSTETVSETTSITVTSTPPPVTAVSGKARTTITITAPTPTRTKVTRVYTTKMTTTTIWATITSTVKTHSPGVVCATSRP